jgi:hypothetical protein
MDLTESYPGKSSSTPELHCETLLNTSPLHREREFHFMTRHVLDRITGYNGSVLTLKTNSNWRIALVLTCAFGIGGLFSGVINLKMFQSLDSTRAEEARIRAAYAKREEDDARYSWSSPGYQFMLQQRERRLLALLRRYGFAALESKTILELGCGTGSGCATLLNGARDQKT